MTKHFWFNIILFFSLYLMSLFYSEFCFAYRYSVLRSYLNDVLCMPLILGFTLFAVRKLYPSRNFVLPTSTLWVSTILVVIAFEWLLPRFYHRFTADIFDVACYILGTLYFAMNQAKWINQRIKSFD